MTSMLASIGVPKKKKLEQKRLTVIELNVFTPTPTCYASFDYDEIKKEFGMASDPDEDDPLVDHDALEIVKRLEAKYGTSSASDKNKSKKTLKKIKYVQEDVMDKGIGYDLEDTFIDDSEAYDEWVPSTMDTAKSGYYVNKGVLEFRQINSDHSSSNSSDSEVEKKSKKQLGTKKSGNKEPSKRKKKVTVEEVTNPADLPKLMDSFVLNAESIRNSHQGIASEVDGLNQTNSNCVFDAKKKAISKPIFKYYSKPSSPGASINKSTCVEAITLLQAAQSINMKTFSPKPQKSHNIVRLSQGGAPPTKKTNMLRLKAQRGVPPTRKMALLNSVYGKTAREQANAKGMDGSTSPKPTVQKNFEKTSFVGSISSNSQPGAVPLTAPTPAPSFCSNAVLQKNEKCVE